MCLRVLFFVSAGAVRCLWQQGCNLFEELLNVQPRLCAYFFENDLVVLSQAPALFLAYIPVLSVYFIGQYCNYGSIATLVLHIVDPLLQVLEGEPVSDVVDYYGDGRVSNVVGDQ